MSETSLRAIQFQAEAGGSAVYCFMADGKRAHTGGMTAKVPLQIRPNRVRANERNPKIGPALKAWMDNVLIPALVQQFRAEKCAVGDNQWDRISTSMAGTSIPEQLQ